MPCVAVDGVTAVAFVVSGKADAVHHRRTILQRTDEREPLVVCASLSEKFDAVAAKGLRTAAFGDRVAER